MKRRVLGLDFLRGLCAYAVAVYHVLYWLNAANLINFSLYGVYLFFVLSGASLQIVYLDKLDRPQDMLSYFLNRLLRIIPLYLLVACLTLVVPPGSFGLTWAGLKALLLNGTLVFGLGNPGMTSMVTGGWSLGIEFQFYLWFPLALFLTRSRAWLIIATILFLAQRIFIERTLAGGDLVRSWYLYTQPLAFAVYFFAGCCIGRVIRVARRKTHPMAWPVLTVSLIVLGAACGASDALSLLGTRGACLTLLTCFAVLCAAFLPIGERLKPVADTLGQVSYGLYLFHPIFFNLLAPRLSAHSPYLTLAAVLLFSTAAAWLSHRFYELPLRDRGRKKFAKAFALRA